MLHWDNIHGVRTDGLSNPLVHRWRVCGVPPISDVSTNAGLRGLNVNNKYIDITKKYILFVTYTNLKTVVTLIHFYYKLSYG